MLRERALGNTLWESVLPAEVRELPPELQKVDAILDQDRFLVPFRQRLTAATGRPTIPIETYLRLMFLKHRYELGYETLCKEVTDSITWRRFCRIALDGRVPDPTTLMKLTRRLGPELLEELNAELLRLAVERKVLRSRRLRVDTMGVAGAISNVGSPCDYRQYGPSFGSDSPTGIEGARCCVGRCRRRELHGVLQPGVVVIQAQARRTLPRLR
jgi:IS5 family transposase